MKRYIDDPGMSPEVVARTSAAAGGICMWVHAVDLYSRVAKEVAPKKQRLEEVSGCDWLEEVSGCDWLEEVSVCDWLEEVSARVLSARMWARE